MGDLREKLIELVEEFKKEGEYLDGPDDDIADKFAGQAYKDCAKRIEELLKKY